MPPARAARSVASRTRWTRASTRSCLFPRRRAEERLYPYLWRFWRDVPGRGHIAIFDRSWYGRVLVERVRGFAAPADWRRAYAEICEFERQLTEQDLIVAKFWLQVSKAEQLRRFKARDEDPLKRFKVDPEDWTNRTFYDAYQAAAAEMVARTNAPAARWTRRAGRRQEERTPARAAGGLRDDRGGTGRLKARQSGVLAMRRMLMSLTALGSARRSRHGASARGPLLSREVAFVRARCRAGHSRRRAAKHGDHQRRRGECDGLAGRARSARPRCRVRDANVRVPPSWIVQRRQTPACRARA